MAPSSAVGQNKGLRVALLSNACQCPVRVGGLELVLVIFTVAHGKWGYS